MSFKGIFCLIFLLLFSIIFAFISTLNLFIIIGGVVLTIISFAFGGDIFVAEAIGLGTKLGLTKMQTGATFLSFFSIVDEIFVVLNSSLRGYSSISFGAVEGSNLVAMGVFLISVIVLGISIKKEFSFDLALLTLIMLILLISSFYYTSISIFLAILLIIIFIVYITRITGHKGTLGIQEHSYSFTIFVASALLVYFASQNIVTISNYFYITLGNNLFFWGLIIAGVAGSIPEGIMFLISLRRNETDTAIGLILSSSIYKATILVAIATLISPVAFKGSRFSIIALLGISAFLFVYVLLRGVMSKNHKNITMP